MALTTKQKQQLKAQAHSLNPVVMLGQHGLTEAVQLAIEGALNDHELIKLRLPTLDKVERQHIIKAICDARKAELVQTIGRILVIYRKNLEK